VRYNTNSQMLLVQPKLGTETIVAVEAMADGSLALSISVENLPTMRFVRLTRSEDGCWKADEHGTIPSEATA
jgi:hypothetical protein